MANIFNEDEHCGPGNSSDEAGESMELGLTGFLFGNIDARGELEASYLDVETKRQLSSLGKFGVSIDDVISDNGTLDAVQDSLDTGELPGRVNEARDSASVPQRMIPYAGLPQRTYKAPLASLRPSKYANIDVRELFPAFEPGKILRFSKIFTREKSSDPSPIWNRVRTPRKAKTRPEKFKGVGIWSSVGPIPSLDQCDTKLEEKFLNPLGCDGEADQSEVESEDSPIPEKGDDVKVMEEPAEFCNSGPSPFDYADEAFLMLTQKNWEDDVIFDASKIKREVEQKLNKGLYLGWKPRVQLLPRRTVPAAGDTSASAKEFFATVAVENNELINSRWEDLIIWDAEVAVPPPRPLVLDPNDENLILAVPDDVDPAKEALDQPAKGKNSRRSKVSTNKKADDVFSPLTTNKDPYNISNDEFYDPKALEVAVKVSSGNVMPHSTPVLELRMPFIPSYMRPSKLRTFHREPLRMHADRPLSTPSAHPVNFLTEHIKTVAARREEERQAVGGGDMFFMRKPEDLSGMDGDLILLEYSEQYPPLLSQVGMCSRIKNLYRRNAKDSAPQYKYGEMSLVHASPFLGWWRPEQSLQAVENNMYRAPIYEHKMPPTDFIIIRSRNGYFIREVGAVFLAGQQCPLLEVPGPNSKMAASFLRDFLQVSIYRLFWNSTDDPRKIRMDDIRRAFPLQSESTIRKRLKQCAEFARTGQDSNWWVMRPDFRLPPEEELRAMVSPEQVCAYLSMMAAAQRLKDAGYNEMHLVTLDDDDDEDCQLKRMEDEVKAAPWNTTRAYLEAMKNRCMLQLTGPADPTGCDEGFSYVRVPNKPMHGKGEPESHHKKAVTGTDGDLRRLPLSEATKIVRKYGVPEEEIRKLGRWGVIDLVRTLATEKAKAGEEGVKFSRGNRFSAAEHQVRYREECQRRFDLQNEVLASDEVLPSDESSDDDPQELENLEKMGKFIEDFLASDKPTSRLDHEREEQERLEMQKTFLGEGSPLEKPKEDDPVAEDYSSKLDGKVLKICRTFQNEDGTRFHRVELVRDPVLIEVYVRVRESKDEAFIKRFITLDDEEREKLKKENRRLRDQQRRLRRVQKNGSSIRRTSTRSRPKADLKMKCGACGQVGHMRTNKSCPSYQNSTSSPSVSSAPAEGREEEIALPVVSEDEGLVSVDGIKVKLSGKLFRRVEEMRRQSPVVKPPKEPARKRRRSGADCDYLKQVKAINRRPRDPVVTLSTMLEEIVNELREAAEFQPFRFPVTSKEAPDYQLIVQRPMDLQTIRENLHSMKYRSREEFLVDIDQVVANSIRYNGDAHSITSAARQLLERCAKRLAEKEEQFMRVEMAINPLLDDNAQVALSYVLDTIVDGRLKSLAEAAHFLRPVSKKTAKDYYTLVETPMDLETLARNVKAHRYRSHRQFLGDVQLILENSVTYNGAESTITDQARSLVAVCKEILEEYKEHLTKLEQDISQDKVVERAEDDLVKSEQRERSGSSQSSLEELLPRRKKPKLDAAEGLNVEVDWGELSTTSTVDQIEHIDDLQAGDTDNEEQINVESLESSSGADATSFRSEGDAGTIWF